MKFDKIEFSNACGTGAQLPVSKEPEIVFSGRSNVGKSSLINRLFNRKNIARVSSTPGKTVTVNFFKGDGVNFVDLPGYGYARRSESEKKRGAELMETYFNSDRNIALVVQLIDIRHKPSDDDYLMLDFLKQSDIPFAIVLTKCDKLNKSETQKRRNELSNELSEFQNVPAVEFSSINGAGTEELKKIIINSTEV